MWGLIIFIAVMALVASILQDKFDTKDSRRALGHPYRGGDLRKLPQEKGKTRYTSTYCKPNYLIVYINQFVEKYKGCIPDDVHDELMHHAWNNRSYVYIEKTPRGLLKVRGKKGTRRMPF